MRSRYKTPLSGMTFVIHSGRESGLFGLLNSQFVNPLGLVEIVPFDQNLCKSNIQHAEGERQVIAWL